jgi:subtilisin family serine protease
MSWPNHPTSTSPTVIGGSSVATATMAGIAALVWSKDPDKSREQVVKALQETAYHQTLVRRNTLSGIIIENKRVRGRKVDKFKGWGSPDALGAIEYLMNPPR